jgi:3-hydroxybutyryl-CoA dehydratase
MSDRDLTDSIEFDKSVIGVDVAVGSRQVTGEEIVAYAKALGETNPLYLDEEAAKAGPYGAIIAPPGFYTSMRFLRGPDPKVQFGNTNLGYMAGQDIEYFEPIRAGDIISAKAQLTNVYAKTGRTGKLVFVVHRTTYSNQHGRTVMVVESSNVRSETMR